MNKSTENFNLSKISTYQAGVIQSQAHRILKKEISNYLSPYGLTMMEWFALGLIKDSEQTGLRMTELASELQTTLPYTTNLINSLMNKGFITRNSVKSDSRVKHLKLSPGINKKCEKIESSLRENMRSLIYSKIQPADLKTYIKVLYLIANQDNQQ